MGEGEGEGEGWAKGGWVLLFVGVGKVFDVCLSFLLFTGMFGMQGECAWWSMRVRERVRGQERRGERGESERDRERKLTFGVKQRARF